MESQIIQKANEVVKNGNFTKLQLRKKLEQCFLIISTPFFSLYGSLRSDAVYGVTNDGIIYLIK